MFSIARGYWIIAWRDGVLTPDPPIDTLGGQLAATLVMQHLARSAFRITLCSVDARSSVSIIPFVGPTSVLPTIDHAISIFAHF
nr:hypothetical protein [Oceaniradius stylonematis]